MFSLFVLILSRRSFCICQTFQKNSNQFHAIRNKTTFEFQSQIEILEFYSHREIHDNQK